MHTHVVYFISMVVTVYQLQREHMLFSIAVVFDLRDLVQNTTNPAISLAVNNVIPLLIGPSQ